MLKSEYITISPTHNCFNTSRTLLLVQLLKLPSSLTPLRPTLKSLHWLKVNERIEYKILSISLSHTPADLHKLISVQPPARTRSSSLITIARPPSSSSLKITDRFFRYASPSLWNNLPVSSVNLVHHLSPPSQHPSLPISSIPDLKLTCSTNSSHHRSSPTHRTAHWTSTGLPSRTPYHSALF